MNIRRFTPADRETYMALTRLFYNSSAVLHSVDEENCRRTFDELMRGGEYLEGYLFTEDGDTAGYALLAKTFSQESGGIACWIEEIYVLEKYRGRGLGAAFFRYLEERRPAATTRFRLEIEPDNTRARHFYERMGFRALPYDQMVKDFPLA